MVQTRIKWIEGICMMGETGSGHAIIMDGAPSHGGRNLGARPMEMLLLGLGGCTAIDIVNILKKGRQNLVDCEIEIQAERAETEPQVFTKIHLHYIVTGYGIKEAQVKRAIDLSADKYCSASNMLNKVAQLTYDYEIREVAKPE
jgi:putative redox protein